MSRLRTCRPESLLNVSYSAYACLFVADKLLIAIQDIELTFVFYLGVKQFIGGTSNPGTLRYIVFASKRSPVVPSGRLAKFYPHLLTAEVCYFVNSLLGHPQHKLHVFFHAIHPSDRTICVLVNRLQALSPQCLR